MTSSDESSSIWNIDCLSANAAQPAEDFQQFGFNFRFCVSAIFFCFSCLFIHLFLIDCPQTKHLLMLVPLLKWMLTLEVSASLAVENDRASHPATGLTTSPSSIWCIIFYHDYTGAVYIGARIAFSQWHCPSGVPLCDAYSSFKMRIFLLLGRSVSQAWNDKLTHHKVWDITLWGIKERLEHILQWYLMFHEEWVWGGNSHSKLNSNAGICGLWANLPRESINYIKLSSPYWLHIKNRPCLC